MFRITQDPSSGSLVYYLAKITLMALSCPLKWTWSMLRQHILTVIKLLNCLTFNLFLKQNALVFFNYSQNMLP